MKETVANANVPRTEVKNQEKLVKGTLDQKSVTYLADPAPVIIVYVCHPDPEATVPLFSRAGPLVLPWEGRNWCVVPLPPGWRKMI